MDPLSQALIGSAAAVSFAKKDKVRSAVICGALSGMFPDIDILIRSSEDSLLAIEYHRHFTHSLIFIPFGGFLMALLFFFLPRKDHAGRLKFSDYYIFCTLGLATHGVLDTATSYGTLLLWPFSSQRISWDIISIIDFIYTLPLLVLIILSYIYKSNLLARGAFIYSFLYLGYGKYQNIRAYNIMEEIAHVQGHKIEKFKLNPHIFTNNKWRSIYQYNGKYHINSIYVPLIGSEEIEMGDIIDVYNIEEEFKDLDKNSTLYKDLQRFNIFTQDFTYLYKKEPLILADLRYNIKINKASNPLWGIEINKDNINSHVKYIHFSRSKK